MVNCTRRLPTTFKLRLPGSTARSTVLNLSADAQRRTSGQLENLKHCQYDHAIIDLFTYRSLLSGLLILFHSLYLNHAVAEILFSQIIYYMEKVTQTHVDYEPWRGPPEGKWLKKKLQHACKVFGLEAAHHDKKDILCKRLQRIRYCQQCT